MTDNILTDEDQTIQKNLIALAYEKMWVELDEYLTPNILEKIRLDYYDASFIEHLIRANQDALLQKVLTAIRLRERKDSFLLATEGPLYTASKEENWPALNILYHFLSNSTNLSLFMQAEDIFYIAKNLPAENKQDIQEYKENYAWKRQHKLVFLKCVLERLPVKEYTTPTQIDNALQKLLEWTQKHDYTSHEVSTLLERLVLNAVSWDKLDVIQFVEEKLSIEYRPTHESYIETVMRKMLKSSETEVPVSSYWFERYYGEIKNNPTLYLHCLQRAALHKIDKIRQEKLKFEKSVPLKINDTDKIIKTEPKDKLNKI